MDSQATCKAYIPDSLFEVGLGHVAICHTSPSGLSTCGIFLVDVYCLGVKDVVYGEFSGAEVEEQLTKINGGHPSKQVDPVYARKLIQDAVAYAQRLGFLPPRDYKKARKIFRHVPDGVCNTVFTFGKDGQPHYMAGPHDSPQQIQKILSVLKAKCGERNFRFLAPIGRDRSLPLEKMDDDDPHDLSPGIRLPEQTTSPKNFTHSTSRMSLILTFLFYILFFFLGFAVAGGISLGLGFLIHRLVPGIELGHAAIFSAIIASLVFFLFSRISPPGAFNEEQDEDLEGEEESD